MQLTSQQFVIDSVLAYASTVNKLDSNIYIFFYYWPAISTPVCSDEDNYLHCQRVIKKWTKSSRESGQDKDKLNLKDLLFFLHVPRTGGRTYFHWSVCPQLCLHN